MQVSDKFDKIRVFYNLEEFPWAPADIPNVEKRKVSIRILFHIEK
ncbi:hypothetical protein EMIT079MI2_30140 [Bacillus sp. IT-79MI2]